MTCLPPKATGIPLGIRVQHMNTVRPYLVHSNNLFSDSSFSNLAWILFHKTSRTFLGLNKPTIHIGIFKIY